MREMKPYSRSSDERSTLKGMVGGFIFLGGLTILLSTFFNYFYVRRVNPYEYHAFGTGSWMIWLWCEFSLMLVGYFIALKGKEPSIPLLIFGVMLPLACTWIALDGYFHQILQTYNIVWTPTEDPSAMTLNIGYGTTFFLIGAILAIFGVISGFVGIWQREKSLR